jgi:hypothetical protein
VNYGLDPTRALINELTETSALSSPYACPGLIYNLLIDPDNSHAYSRSEGANWVVVFHSRRPPLIVEKYPLTPWVGVQASRCQEFHMQTLDVFR